jgi:AcrR family transcriptional regulator
MGTRATLIQAAAELMVEVGFDAMTTAALAKRAGLAEGTLYRHFPGKEAITEAVFEDAWKSNLLEIEAELPPLSEPEARLRDFLPITLAVMLRNPVRSQVCNQCHMHWIQQKRLADLPPGPRDLVELLEETLRNAQVAGVARADFDPFFVANLLFHAGGDLLERFVIPPSACCEPRYTPEAFQEAWNAFLNPRLFMESR